MIEANINYMDAVILGIMLISCLVAFIRGFLKEILALGGWIAASTITLLNYEKLGAWIQEQGYVKKEMIAGAAAAVIIFVICLICFSIINRVLVKYTKSGADIGILDNCLGLLFGGVRGAFIVSLGFFLLTYIFDKDQYPEWIETAHTRPYAEKGAELLARLAPQSLEEMSSLAKNKANEIKEEKDSVSAGGYNETARDRMNQLFGGTSSLPETIDDTREERAPVRYQ